MEFKTTKDENAQRNKMFFFFLAKIKKIYTPRLASVVHLAYFSVLGLFEVFVAAFNQSNFI